MTTNMLPSDSNQHPPQDVADIDRITVLTPAVWQLENQCIATLCTRIDVLILLEAKTLGIGSLAYLVSFLP